jgi:hypothetical protein
MRLTSWSTHIEWGSSGGKNEVFAQLLTSVFSTSFAGWPIQGCVTTNTTVCWTRARSIKLNQAKSRPIKKIVVRTAPLLFDNSPLLSKRHV